MRSDLDGPVSSVGGTDHDDRLGGVQGDDLLGCKDLSRGDGCTHDDLEFVLVRDRQETTVQSKFQVSIVPCDGRMDSDEFGPIREGTLDLNFMEQSGYFWHDVLDSWCVCVR